MKSKVKFNLIFLKVVGKIKKGFIFAVPYEFSYG